MDCQGLIVVFLQHMAVSIGFEPMRPFLNDSLANCCINHSANSPCLVPTSGIEPLSTVLQTVAMTTSAKLVLFGGSGEIRTHGPFLIVSFQDWCNKPDSATLPYFWYSRRDSNPRPYANLALIPGISRLLYR